MNTNFICRVKNELVGVILCGHDGRHAYISFSSRQNMPGKLLQH